MKEGERVVIFRDRRANYLVRLKKGLTLRTHHGDIKHDDILGLDYGSLIKTHLGKDFYILPPTHYDRMMKVKRKTTIVYPKDAGWFMLKTSVGPGSRVIEVGTGSGSLTIFLASIVGKEGKVYSYERRDDLLENAIGNVESYGLKDRVVFHLEDVEAKGFKEREVDAVFLDVPEPWTLIPHARKALKGGYHLVSLSPNVEQVKKTVLEMKVNNFIRNEIVEILLREIMVREVGTRPREQAIVHTGYLITAQKTG
ncbi:MAG TPA: tRNA (adenine-N1)-methyltransferase [bacterium (Candidatus Stahlbacteria)]|nr:tRNA (adenine-N1)-methyltransferase [Candidatus Stahlbacteria bacterium]